jgi:putative aldouronate transport system permease protein
MALAGYALSKKTLPGRKIITTYFIFTMFFSGGIIPTYLLVRDLHLLNNIWILVLIPMFSAYYILILRSYFSGIPNEILEAAKIDGAGELRTFFQIVTPLSIPALITIGTWMFFNHWNAWFDCLLYIQDIDKQVVQIHIRRIVIEQSQLLLAGVMQIGVKANMPTEESIRAAGIMITIVPVLIIYPFVKRFFVKGATLGAVKG